MRYKDKIVLVIGGNSGIGLAAAKAFVEEGARVVITGRNPETLAGALKSLGSSAHAIRGDVSSLTDLRATMSEIGTLYGRIDTMFVNAGIGAFIRIDDVTEEDWYRIQDTNLKGAYFVVQAALPLMGKGSSIVFCGSVGHCKALVGNSLYATTKAGLRSLARSLGLELLDRGIRVNCVSPGPIDTPIMDRSSGGDPAVAAKLRAQMAAAVPMKRLGTPEELARAVLFLGSDDASFITGADLPVDGGLSNF